VKFIVQSYLFLRAIYCSDLSIAHTCQLFRSLCCSELSIFQTCQSLRAVFRICLLLKAVHCSDLSIAQSCVWFRPICCLFSASRSRQYPAPQCPSAKPNTKSPLIQLCALPTADFTRTNERQWMGYLELILNTCVSGELTLALYSNCGLLTIHGEFTFTATYEGHYLVTSCRLVLSY